MSRLSALSHLPVRSTILIALASSSVRQITVALTFGIILGLITLLISPKVALVGMMGLLLLIMAFTNPEVVILVVLCFASGLIPSRFNLFVNLLVGHFQVSDLLLLCLLVVVLFRVFTDRSFHYVKTPLDLPILLFFGAVVVGLANAVLRFGISFSNATFEARMLMFYLIFFAITNLIRTQSQLIRLIRGVITIGLLIAVTMIVESTLGRVDGTVNSGGVEGEGVVRVFIPSATLVYVVLVTLVSHLAVRGYKGYPLLPRLQVVLLGVALFTTLGRNLVVSLAVVFALLIAILPTSERSRLGRNVLWIACITIVLVSLLALAGVETKVVDYSVAFLERLERMFSPEILAPGENLLPRWEEIRFAWAQISKHPILGIGLHNTYRPSFYLEEPQSLRYFIHNAYLSIWLKTGLVGLVSFLWLSAVFLRRGFRYWRGVQNVLLRSVTIGFTLAYLGTMLSNLVAPSFVQPGSLIIFGVALGINELILLNTEVAKEDKNGDTSYRPHNINIQG